MKRGTTQNSLLTVNIFKLGNTNCIREWKVSLFNTESLRRIPYERTQLQISLWELAKE